MCHARFSLYLTSTPDPQVLRAALAKFESKMLHIGNSWPGDLYDQFRQVERLLIARSAWAGSCYCYCCCSGSGFFPRLLAMASTGFCGRRSVNVRHHYQTQFRICLHSAATAQRVNGVKTWPRFSSVQFGTVQYGMVRLEFAWIEESQQLSRSEWLEGQCGTRC